LIGSPGQRNDLAFAHDLVQGFEVQATISDQGYDAD
jgi:putative transposase